MYADELWETKGAKVGPSLFARGLGSQNTYTLRR